MAEEIKVVLEADASQLTGEFKKARAAVESFANKTLPLTTMEMNRVFVEQQRVSKALAMGQKGVKNYGQGMLQMAQFADDAQYGLRGVMNNIPGLVMGLGGGAGLAGALSIATLAGAKLLPVLKRLIAPGEDTDQLKEVADQLSVLRKRSEELAALRGSENAKAFIAQLDAEEAGITRQNRALALSLDLLNARAIATRKIADAQDRFEMVRIAADQSLSPDQKASQTAAVQNRQARRQAQEELDALTARVKAADRLAADKKAAVSRQQADAARLTQQIAEEENRRRELQQKISAGDLASRSLPGAQAAVDNFKTPGGLTGSVQERAKQVLDARQKLIDEVNRLSSASAYGESFRPEFNAVDSSLKEQRAALDELLKREKALAEESNRAGMARDFARKSAEAEAAAVIKIYETEKAARGLPAASATAAATASRSAASAELRRLQNQATDVILDRQARFTASTIATAGGSTSKIRRGGRTAGLQINGLQTSRGLRSSAEERDRRARAPVANTMETRAAAYYDRSLQNEERMIKAFESLGIL